MNELFARQWFDEYSWRPTDPVRVEVARPDSIHVLAEHFPRSQLRDYHLPVTMFGLPVVVDARCPLDEAIVVARDGSERRFKIA